MEVKEISSLKEPGSELVLEQPVWAHMVNPNLVPDKQLLTTSFKLVKFALPAMVVFVISLPFIKGLRRSQKIMKIGISH